MRVRLLSYPATQSTQPQELQQDSQDPREAGLEKGAMGMKNWFVNFRNDAGHTTTHFVEASKASSALRWATLEYAKNNGISQSLAEMFITEMGLR